MFGVRPSGATLAIAALLTGVFVWVRASFLAWRAERDLFAGLARDCPPISDSLFPYQLCAFALQGRIGG